MSSEAMRWWRASLESYDEDAPPSMFPDAMGEDIESVYSDGLVIDTLTGMPTTRDPHEMRRRARKHPSRVDSQNARAAKKRLRADLTAEQWEAILQAFFFACAYCGDDRGALVMDHVIPIARGGGTTRENIVPACGYCNGSKGAKTIEEWCRECLKDVASILDRIERGRATMEQIEKCAAFE